MNILNQYQTASLTDTAGAAANAARRQATSSDSIRMTATIVSTIPIIMVYPFVQKYFCFRNYDGSSKRIIIKKKE